MLSLAELENFFITSGPGASGVQTHYKLIMNYMNVLSIITRCSGISSKFIPEVPHFWPVLVQSSPVVPCILSPR